MFGRDAYAAVPYGGTLLPPPVVGTLPPPIPGDPATYAYTTLQVARPWAYLSWAGGYPPASYPGGGILTHAEPDAGVIRVRVWWPDAALLHLVRIGTDGARTPVRGAYPIAVTAPTRRNRCLNPSVEAGLNGYVPADGNPTLTGVADAAAPAGNTVLRLTNAAAGPNGVAVPTVLTGLAAGTTMTLGVALRFSAAPTTATLSIAWLATGGSALSTTTAALTADERGMAVNTFLRTVQAMTVPVGAVDGTLKVIATGMPAGGTVDLDAISVEAAATDGSAFDGTAVGGTWLGTPHLSASVAAPELLVFDAECPLDALVTYEVAYQAITGGRVTSTPPVLLVGGGGSWITHPARPGETLKVDLARVPRLERTVNQGVFLPIGAARPVVVSAARRQAPTTTLEFVLLSFRDRDALLSLLDDPHPLLLRLPAEFGYAAPMWLAVGRVIENRDNRKGWHDSVILEAEATEVNAPSVVV
jgi:hypothetical protein